MLYISIEFAPPRLSKYSKYRTVSHRQLQKIVKLSTKSMGGRAGTRFNAIISLAFFVLLQLGEYCVTKQKHHLLQLNLIIHSDGIEITFETCKFFSSPVKVTLKKSYAIACPIKCMRKYLNLHQQQSEEPLLEVSTPEFRRDVNGIGRVAQITDGITPHALKRVGTTCYSDSGWSDAKICAHG